MCSLSVDFEEIVVINYSISEAYIGSADLTKRMLSLIEGISHKIAALIHIGNPYAVRELPDLPIVLIGFHGGSCETAALRVLSGEIEATGKMPVRF